MARVRRHLTVVAIAWLLFQAGGYALSPLVDCCARPIQAAGEDAVEDDDCCKGMAPGQMCPLHRHRQPTHDTDRHDQAPAGCAMSSSCSPVDSALLSLSFGLGILAPSVSSAVSAVSVSVDVPPVSVRGLASSLDPPPPRL